ncbi:MAG: methyltransferase domain-containing protein [Chloroflexi bacterium]|nr:methyltransferase domain-containing protein [Chloroflexota bacterium]MBM3176068.1 methyltransferase domain-containing protein [Chloroflexota bacterium]MBM4451511.1 methyltransferase domain-containing protein [Chloroflexota bacterium]MBM4453794.1 methyltransferase domain-containing protein [Chloroflexota bacterium]
MIRTFFNQKASIWDESIAEKDTAKLEGIAKRLNIEPGAAVLDIGTGTGVFVPYLIRKIGENGHLVALDVAEKMLQVAQAKSTPGNITYLQADVTFMPLAGEFFDAVVCYSSFPHFENKPAALCEIRRVLKKGGRLFVCHTASRDKINVIHSQIPGFANHVLPNRDAMNQLLLNTGFAGVEIYDGSDSYLAAAMRP